MPPLALPHPASLTSSHHSLPRPALLLYLAPPFPYLILPHLIPPFMYCPNLPHIFLTHPSLPYPALPYCTLSLPQFTVSHPTLSVHAMLHLAHPTTPATLPSFASPDLASPCPILPYYTHLSTPHSTPWHLFQFHTYPQRLYSSTSTFISFLWASWLLTRHLLPLLWFLCLSLVFNNSPESHGLTVFGSFYHLSALLKNTVGSVWSCFDPRGGCEM